MDSLSICYNITDNKLPGMPPLPEVYIVPVTNESLGYVEKQATPATLKSFDIPYLETDHEQLLKICAELKPIILENQFKPAKKRKNYGLTDILKDPKIKLVVLEYVNKKLATFYSLVIKNQYAITHNAQRKDPFEVHRLSISNTILNPILEFTKTDEGFDYSFSLEEEDTILIPQNHEIQILLNEPSWVAVDKKIYHIKNLNANKLKPFFDKEKITIAKKFIKTYLDKVIIPVIKDVDVVANGFDIIINQHIASYKIEIIQDFIKEDFVAKVVFNYEEASFDFNSTKKTASDVLFANFDDIKITQTQRDLKKEKEIIALLESKGLVLNNNLLLEMESAEDPLAIFNWVQQNHVQLEKEGFTIVLPSIEDRAVNMEKHQIELQNKKKMTGSISGES
ncbi:hypothetical protein GCM10022393_29310 [Aquimarina addita]|uniref:Phage portal protein n=1 Tax=Aquimarina addita TaxID=870485 RepID=A0ABP6UMX2_9FLAO